MPYNPERKKIIDIGVFIYFFNEEEISCLSKEEIDLSDLPKNPSPLFNYAQYLHILDIGAIEKATDAWMKNNFGFGLQNPHHPDDYSIKRMKKSLAQLPLPIQQGTKIINEEYPSIRAKNAMIDSLCKMFMRSALNLKYLILSPYDPDKDMPRSRIFIDNEPGLANLRKLKVRFYANLIDQHERRENLYDLLKLLPNVCNGLVQLDVNRIMVPNCVIAEILTGLIKSQPELTYCRFYKVYGDMNKLIGALPVHKLTSLVLDDLILSGLSLSSLSRSTRLEYLVFRKCRSLSIELIQPILKAPIKLKYLYLSDLPNDVLKAIIIKSSEALEQVSIKFRSEDISEGLETLVNHCQNITHLSLSAYNGPVDILSVISIISLLKHITHLKLSFANINIGDELENGFSKLQLEKLQYLELINFDIIHLKGYLSKCCSPLSTIIMDVIEESNLQIFLDFSRERNTLKWVGFDYIHPEKYLKVCQRINESADCHFQIFHAKQVRIREKYF
ncbi:8357_t:CDS:1 [Funneliformis geosporum]|uniref:3970_t:CDS:1 n=1 Tax=Funneliformis geosporum TaxID=1117311 RepID=A0A9W4STE9_9GLOM|nr:3970_t:CDS:1 [Funneliformis geosporum]CAI2183935.1 8357_t:CDS:1 [Funneliformis geosporum]